MKKHVDEKLAMDCKIECELTTVKGYGLLITVLVACIRICRIHIIIIICVASIW